LEDKESEGGGESSNSMERKRRSIFGYKRTDEGKEAERKRREIEGKKAGWI
jgi:hypothetical protein